MNYELFENLELPEKISSPELLEEGVFREVIGRAEQTAEIPEQTELIIGQPEDVENWHVQAEPMSCTVSTQELVAEQLLDQELSESEMIDHARRKGWYDPVEGASKADTGKLLEEMGFEVQRENDMEFTDLLEALASGEKVICAVDMLTLNCPEAAGLPGRRANHVVQLVAVDLSDPENPQVILNDTGVPNGQGIRHDLDTFMQAWKTSRNFAVTVGKGDAA